MTAAVVVVLALIGCGQGSDSGVDVYFTSVRYSSIEVCGLTNLQTIECYPEQWHFPAPAFGLVPVIDFEMSYEQACIASGAAGLTCVLEETVDESDDVAAPVSTAIVSEVHVAYRRVCGESSDGKLVCWGDGRCYDEDPSEQVPVGEGPYLSWDIGYCGHGCGVRSDGSIECWGGTEDDGIFDVPDGTFQSVSVAYAACAVSDLGAIECWNAESFGGHDAPADELFIGVDVTVGGACGLTTDGDITCWGDDEYNYDAGNTYVGPYVAMSYGGADEVCALRADAGIDCPSGRLGKPTPSNPFYASH